MNLNRLVALGILSSEGPLHGHAIRRRAEKVSVERWGGVSVGALHRELHLLERDGLIAVVRCEQAGRRPLRTVYGITPEGERELAILRESALRDLRSQPDPVGVGLLFGGRVDPRETTELLRLREQRIRAELEQVISERTRLAESLSPMALAVFHRQETLLAAELRWHEDALGLLARDAPSQALVPMAHTPAPEVSSQEV